MYANCVEAFVSHKMQQMVQQLMQQLEYIAYTAECAPTGIQSLVWHVAACFALCS